MPPPSFSVYPITGPSIICLEESLTHDSLHSPRLVSVLLLRIFVDCGSHLLFGKRPHFVILSVHLINTFVAAYLK